MKLFKSLILYFLIFIFILSLTSSFVFNQVMNENITDLSINSSKMHEVFYYSSEPNNNDTESESDNSTTETPNDTNISSIEYDLGDSGEEVYKYQKLLYYLDYINTTPDGNFRDNMKLAVENYQEDKLLEVTGKLDFPTMEMLTKEEIEYKNGKNGDEILEFQLILYYQDYLQVYPEGLFGNVTEDSIENYQQENSLTVNGILDIPTQNSLLLDEIIYTSGKEGKQIKEFQNILISLNYLSGEADGQYGNKTTNAVKKYQGNNSLETNGTIDIATQESLLKPLEEQVSNK
ncbi:MAG: peptidoglycan-binding protein [Eubacteriaceae bacterium]